MTTLMHVYRALSRSEAVSTSEIRSVLQSEITAHQFVTLALRLYRRAPDYIPLVEPLIHKAGAAEPYLRHLCPRFLKPDVSGVSLKDSITDLLDNTSKHRVVGRHQLARLIEWVVEGTVPVAIQALWLEKVFQDGISSADLEHLVVLMRDSGRIYDYRDLAQLDHRRVIRRYPTGALSEKTALVLPSLLSEFRELPIVSPFLVARSLGYTGGTWDKLSAIPGFMLLPHGDAAVQAMKSCGVTMVATSDDVDPADRKFYQLRSATGTIESPELIIASIASKQLAIPADFLLLDVRFGAGAFLDTRSTAEEVARQIIELLGRHGMDGASVFTDTPQPNGTAVGNSLEVLEAISLMGGPARLQWDQRAIEEQRNLIVGFFATLMTHEFGSVGGSTWETRALERFESGDVFKAFLQLLMVHQVPESVRNMIATAPEKLLLPEGEPLRVLSPVRGTLVGIDQPQIGYFVNTTLGGGGNDYAGTFNPLAGVQLRKRLGDLVEAGEPVAFVYGSPDEVDLSQMRDAFAFA